MYKPPIVRCPECKSFSVQELMNDNEYHCLNCSHEFKLEYSDKYNIWMATTL